MLKLAIDAKIPLLHVRTDDPLYAGRVLSHIAGIEFGMLQLPPTLESTGQLEKLSKKLYYTSSECGSLTKLYKFAEDNGIVIVFVNTERSVMMFDCGELIPPKALVLSTLMEYADEESAEALLPSFGGMTLKDVIELCRLTQTKDGQMTVRGVNSIRRAYRSKLKGIQQIDSSSKYYICPTYLAKWMDVNETFFKQDIHESLTPRGLLFDGPPGTGKTMASKYIADRLGVPLYHLDLGSLMGKYVGDSENNLNAALHQIDQVEPCVVLFDEVEKIFQTSSDGGVTSRLLSQLLWWLQEHKTRVFSVMTTNDKSKIPPELYREGRIDLTMTFAGLETETEGQTFAAGALASMAEEIGAELEKEHYDLMHKRISTLFTDVEAVPQGKVSQVVYTLLRELLSAD